MTVLALDSTEKTASAALTANGRLIAEVTLNTGNTHSEHLLPMIDGIMKCSGLGYDDIDLFAFSAGPGSFTGVRIGAATVKGLAFGRNKPCVGVSALEAMAYSLPFVSGIICPVMDARRSQLYNALFRSDGQNIVRLTEDRTIPADVLADELSSLGEKTAFIGGGYDIIAKAADGKIDVINTSEALKYESALSVAILAEKQYNEGNYVSDVDLRPIYLRPSQAERMKNGDNS